VNSADKKIILPGATIGVLGSGQLGRMMTQAAIRMGYNVHCFSPDASPSHPSPCAQAGARETIGDYEDLEAVTRFAQSVDVVTFEFENVGVKAGQAAAQFVPVYPDPHVLYTTQNRLREKTWLQENGFPIANFTAPPVFSGIPSVLKTAGFGYDGKGQVKVNSREDLDKALLAWDDTLCVLEEWVVFDRELSVVAARNAHGEFAAFPVVQNEHSHHILDVTTASAPDLDPKIVQIAQKMAQTVLEELNVVGVLCMELFLTTNGNLVINELAPRPHNSGHWTIEGAETSQFEQQVRAVCGLPLGSVAMRHGGVAMANLLGDVWPTGGGQPAWENALAIPGVSLHLYGKTEPRIGRKMGHLTATADTPQEAAQKVREARQSLNKTTHHEKTANFPHDKPHD
jgi:5-(carboxyamino)imidazole ribonucleotide synthase